MQQLTLKHFQLLITNIKTLFSVGGNNAANIKCGVFSCAAFITLANFINVLESGLYSHFTFHCCCTDHLFLSVHLKNTTMFCLMTQFFSWGAIVSDVITEMPSEAVNYCQGANVSRLKYERA